MKDITIGKILANNPQIDKAALKKSMELLKKMREAGLKTRKHHLTSPYVRRVTKVGLQKNRAIRSKT